MHLGYLVPEFPGQTHAFFWREVQALRGFGVEVDLLSTRRPPLDSCAHAFAAAAREQTTYLFPPRPLSWPRAVAARTMSASLTDYFAQLPETGPKAFAREVAVVASALELRDVARARGLDHIHVHSAATAAHVAAGARLLGGPSYSLTLHGDLDVYGTGHAQKFRAASFVSVVTHALQTQVAERLGLPATFLPVIRMGVDVGTFVPTTRHERGEFNAVTIARLNHTKGHVYALEAIAQLRSQGLNVLYRIAGSGPEEGAIRHHIARLGLTDVAIMLGSLAEHQVRELLHDADVFLLTSFGLGEAAPVSVMEAMASGCPVICSRVGGTPEIIEDQQDGLLVSQQDASAVADALRRLMTSPELRAQLSEAARRRALADFDSVANARRLLDAMLHPPTSP